MQLEQNSVTGADIKSQTGQDWPYLVGLNLSTSLEEGAVVQVSGYNFTRAAKRAYRVYCLFEDQEAALAAMAEVMTALEEDNLFA